MVCCDSMWQSYDISVVLDGPSQLRVQAERLGSEEVLELVLAGVMTLSLLVKGGKVPTLEGIYHPGVIQVKEICHPG